MGLTIIDILNKASLYLIVLIQLIPLRDPNDMIMKYTIVIISVVKFHICLLEL